MVLNPSGGEDWGLAGPTFIRGGGVDHSCSSRVRGNISRETIVVSTRADIH